MSAQKKKEVDNDEETNFKKKFNHLIDFYRNFGHKIKFINFNKTIKTLHNFHNTQLEPIKVKLNRSKW